MGENGEIIYPANLQSKVEEAKKRVFGSGTVTVMGATVELSDADEVIERLRNANVKFSKFEKNGKLHLHWDPSENTKASIIVEAVKNK